MHAKHIKDLIPDAKNARKHNDRILGMLEKSLNEVGAARSIVIDENNRILAGNGTVEAAAAAGIERVRVIEADGNEIIAVRRSGLSEEQKTKLALYDNRTAELAEWDEEALKALEVELSLDDIFSENELKMLYGEYSDNSSTGIADVINEGTDSFQASFVLPIESRQTFDSYVKIHGKQLLVTLIIGEINAKMR